MKSQVIVIGGLPCSGKTTLAKELSGLLDAPTISKDELEAAVVRTGLTSNKNMNGVGYEIMATIANAHAASNSSVILDFVATKPRVLECCPSLLKTDFKYIECICSDEQMHKQRIESRQRNIEGWYELTWEEVESIKGVYVPLRSERLILDSTNKLNENAKLAVNYLQNESV